MSELQRPLKILVTGGAGFIGSTLIRDLLTNTDAQVLNVDKLTYAACFSSVDEFAVEDRFQFVEADVCDPQVLREIFDTFQPGVVFHAAAESHVDRSIAGPAEFIQTNLVGTYELLEVSRRYWASLSESRQRNFRFIHVSTDEVYGSLGSEGHFVESSPYDPRSPYSASKAGSDHLVMAWHHTYGLPTIKTHSSNNYGPFQFPEKLVPLMILNALDEKPLPIYGTGDNIRDWVHVEDHVRALRHVMQGGRIGESYNIGANNERTNFQIVTHICDLLDEIQPRSSGSYRELIEFVSDRPGHDKRYSLDVTKLTKELAWRPTVTFDEGLASTVRWYLDNDWWWKPYRDAS